MDMAAWLPDELRRYEKAWRLWGILIRPGEDMTPEKYSACYGAKFSMLVDKERECGNDPQDILESMLAESWMRVEDDAVAHLMWDYDELLGPRSDMGSYLRGELSLEDLKRRWGLDMEEEGSLTTEEQYEIVKDLLLSEYLEHLPL